jgi:hypothetical protein
MNISEISTNQQVIVHKARGYTQRGWVLEGRKGDKVLVHIPAVGAQEWHPASKLTLA